MSDGDELPDFSTIYADAFLESMPALLPAADGHCLPLWLQCGTSKHKDYIALQFVCLVQIFGHCALENCYNRWSVEEYTLLS